MDKKAVSKFLGIKLPRVLGSLENSPLKFKANELVLVDIIYAGQNDFKTILEMVQPKTEKSGRKLFICKETKLIAHKDDKKEFIIKKELNPIVVVYTNKSAISCLKEVGPKINKINDETMTQHLMRETENNGYFFSAYIQENKPSPLEVKEVFMLNGNEQFVPVKSDADIEKAKKSSHDGIVSKAVLMESINKLHLFR
jgi:hypothetical protein